MNNSELLQEKRPTIYCLALGKGLTACSGGDYSPLLSPSEITSGNLCPVPCSPDQERHEHHEPSSVNDCEGDEGTGASLMEDLRAGTPEKRKLRAY